MTLLFLFKKLSAVYVFYNFTKKVTHRSDVKKTKKTKIRINRVQYQLNMFLLG